MKMWARKQRGFTIVELLIVIVVIAILAAISIVAYTGIQDRTNNAVVENNLSDLAKTIAVWKVDNSGVYPAIGQLTTVNIQINKDSYYMTTRNNFYYCVNADGSQYAFGVVSKSNQGYMLTNGQVTKRSGNATYQADTCTTIGEDTASGTSAYNGATGAWANWVKG